MKRHLESYPKAPKSASRQALLLWYLKYRGGLNAFQTRLISVYYKAFMFRARGVDHVLEKTMIISGKRKRSLCFVDVMFCRWAGAEIMGAAAVS